MLKNIIDHAGLWNGWLFMSVFIWQMIVVGFGGKAVRKRTHVRGEKRAQYTGKWIAVLANFFWLLALGYSIFLPLRTGTIWFYSGLIIFLAGVLILSVATTDFMTTPVTQPIQKGAYRLSRHPMYLATFLICLGTGLATVSVLFEILTLIMALFFHFEALLEEKVCLESYPEYKLYMRQVPRWVGRFKIKT